MKHYLLSVLLCWTGAAFAQTLNQKLEQAVQQLQQDPQLQHAAVSFCVYNTKTGDTVYTHNAALGLAPASTQKIFTSIAAFDLLGKNFRYTTRISYHYFRSNPARSYFIIRPTGDPSFGSSRYTGTHADEIMEKIITGLRQRVNSSISPEYVITDSAYGKNTVPGGWLWEDIGNYYGASAQAFNWQENQYDIVMKSGSRVGDSAHIIATRPDLPELGVAEHLTSADKGTGDNTIVYLNYGSAPASIEGTIPVNENAFVVSASMPNPQDIFKRQLNEKMKEMGINLFYGFNRRAPLFNLPDSLYDDLLVYSHQSPTLDSLNYWFLQKSINLYGEALLKTMALQKGNLATTEKGVDLLTDYWADQGIDKASLHICDGSGLSPRNRVTAEALVKALQYAKTRPWFSSFYAALPEHNGMKMKSGAIGGVRSFAGYQRSAAGTEYAFAIMVNNFDGKPADLLKKMYALLDYLK